VNVNGTNNVITAAARSGVRALVYTSTMDVLYDGGDILGGDETMPYPKKFTMVYAETKAIAEQAVLKANSAAAPMKTCVIRPCGMFGEGDPYHVSSFLKMAQSGRLAFAWVTAGHCSSTCTWEMWPMPRARREIPSGAPERRRGQCVFRH